MDLKNYEYPPGVLHALNTMRERSQLTDIILEVEGRRFPCHRAVLASCSVYFHTMFTSGYAEAKQGSVSIQDVSQVAMATILDYAYTGCLKTEPDQIQAVMSAARLLQVDFVFRKAAEYMKDHLEVSNCADVFMYADMVGDDILQEASKKYVASRFHQVALQPSFLQLSLPQLQSLLNMDDLICTEDHVVEAALRWMESDKDERLKHLPTLCRYFRRSFISSKCLEELESKYLSADCKLVYSSSTKQRLGEMRAKTLIFLRREVTFMRSIDSSEPAPCFDPSKRELYMMKMPEGLSTFSVAVTSDDELYLAGCNTLPMSARYKRKKFFLQYNHLLCTWEPRCDMISPRDSCGLVYLEGYIYAIGGDDTQKSAERYDPSCDKWTSIAPIPQPMSPELCAVALDDKIYVMSEAGCYRYSATENAWSKMADMLAPPSCPQAVTHQGCIYCVDCVKTLRDCTSVYVYDPKQETWKRTRFGRNFAAFFSFHVATLIPYMESLYLLTVSSEHKAYSDEEPGYGHPSNYGQYPKINIYQYQPGEDCWLVPDNARRMIPPMRRWLEATRWTDCLVAQMIPKCLGDDVACQDYDRVYVEADIEEFMGSEEESETDLDHIPRFGSSPGSRDSEEVSEEEENSDEDNDEDEDEDEAEDEDNDEDEDADADEEDDLE